MIDSSKRILDKPKRTEQTLNRQRLDYIDVAKGIGIILVVLSHIINQDSIINAIIYSFHVPLFFILSGLFINPKQSFTTYFIKNVKRLLFPFVLFFLVGFGITYLVPRLAKTEITDVIRQLVYAKPTEINVGPIWFLACLFDVSLLFYFYYKFILTKNNTIMTILSLGILGVVAYYLPLLEEKMGVLLPFKLDVAFMALFFYVLGWLLKDVLLRIESFKSIVFKVIICAILIAFVTSSTYFVLGLTNLSGGMYGSNLYMYLFTAFCGSLLVIIVSTFLKNIKVLTFLGKNSLVIFSLHTIILIPLNYLMELFGIPNNIVVSLFETIIVLLIMVIICFLINTIKNKANSLVMKK